MYVFVKQFKHYLLGRPFIIRTDHKALTWLLNWDNPNTSQYCSWIAELEVYDFKIQHRPGEKHLNADFLSRLNACEQCGVQHDEPKKKRNVKVLHQESTQKHVRSINTIQISLRDKEEVLKMHHEGMGHIGFTKMLNLIKQHYN